MEATAHTLRNATLAGLILSGVGEYGFTEFIGTDEQWREFKRLENEFEMEKLQDSQNDLI